MALLIANFQIADELDLDDTLEIQSEESITYLDREEAILLCICLKQLFGINNTEL